MGIRHLPRGNADTIHQEWYIHGSRSKSSNDNSSVEGVVVVAAAKAAAAAAVVVVVAAAAGAAAATAAPALTPVDELFSPFFTTLLHASLCFLSPVFLFCYLSDPCTF